jgi:hypothetical protein
MMSAIIGRSYGARVAFPVWELILVSIASRTLHSRRRAQIVQESAESGIGSYIRALQTVSRTAKVLRMRRTNYYCSV